MPLDRAANIHFRCEVTQASGGAFRLELRVGVSGASPSAAPRIIEAPTCEQVAETAAVAIALALGADAPEAASGDTAGDKGDANSPSSERDATATAQPKAAEKSNVEVVSGSIKTGPSASSHHLWGAARLGPIFDWGSLPGISVGLQGTFEVGYRAASARLSGAIFGDKREELADGSGGEFSLWVAAMSVCGGTPRERAHGSLCAGLELGQMKGSGFGSLRVAKVGTAWWVTPKVDLEVVSAPWLFGMRAYVGAMAGLPLARPPFTLGGAEEVHRADSLVWRLNAGLEIDWQ